MSGSETRSLSIRPLGTNGFYPSWGRQTMCIQVASGALAPDRLLLFDAGTGLGRLVSRETREGEPEHGSPELSPDLSPHLSDAERLDVVLTHYHLDHVVGLATLSHAFTGHLVLHAPEPPLVDGGPAALERLLSPPLFPVALDDFRCRLEVRPFSGDELAIEGLELPLRLRRQRHRGGSVGVRLGDLLAYVTDAAFDEATVDFASRVALLLHEMWVTDEEARSMPGVLSGHASVSEVRQLAERAQVGRLWPVHHHPGRSPRELEELIAGLAQSTRVPVELATEGAWYEVRRDPDGAGAETTGKTAPSPESGS